MPVFGALPEYDFEYGLELQSQSFMLVVTVTWPLGWILSNAPQYHSTMTIQISRAEASEKYG